jgi:hypothetical protein
MGAGGFAPKGRPETDPRASISNSLMTAAPRAIIRHWSFNALRVGKFPCRVYSRANEEHEGGPPTMFPFRHGRARPRDPRGSAPRRSRALDARDGPSRRGADFNSASSEIKALSAFFCNGARLSLSQLVRRSRARSAVRPSTTSCGFEASEPLPFPGPDSIFSSRCGAISGRLRFAVSLSRAIPATETPRFKKSTIGSAAFAGTAERGQSRCGSFRLCFMTRFAQMTTIGLSY